MRSDTYTAFDGNDRFAQGSLVEVISKVKRRVEKSKIAAPLIFSDETGKQMDFNLQGSESDVLKRLEVYLPAKEAESSPGPGRPKLGVISREVSLLPQHWEWLAIQPGGASSTLRKLVEEAKRRSAKDVDIQRAQERTYRVMSVLAGNAEGYEEALRALYRKDRRTFAAFLKEWPTEVREYLMELAKPVFKEL